MTNREHLLTIVEPTTGGDATLELAHETVARGGSASVVMVITDRVQRDIRAFADSEDLDRGEAEALALDQLRNHCSDRVGGSPELATHYGALGSNVVKYVTADTTAIAIPERLVADKFVQRIVTYSGRPVIVAPSRIALSQTRAEARLSSRA